MSEMFKDSLKCCPFCGGEAEIRMDTDSSGGGLYVTDAHSDVSGAGLRSCEPLRVWRQAAVCAM